MWRVGEETGTNFLALVLVILGGHNISRTEAQIAAYDVHLKDLLVMQKGQGWPSELLVEEGQEALMRLVSSLGDTQTCTVTTPTGLTFDVSSPPDSRYEHWSDGCGLRVRKVTHSDQGRWRLSATHGARSIVGWTEVTVRENVPSYTAPPISLHDGERQANVELTSLDNSYCVVTQPFSESSLVPGHCSVTLDRASRAVQGNWNVLIGVPGRVSELRVDRQVAVQAERLDVGFDHDLNTNKVHLYCNILHSTKNITFCRFQKTTDSFGYNVMEGLSDGKHSYYGRGFVAKECGMTIEHLTSDDFGTWRCSVGSQQWVSGDLQQQAPMQALINVIPHQRRSGRDESHSLMEEERTVFVQKGSSFTVVCRSEVSLHYCWFLHPNGTQFSPVAHESQNQLFWYSGESLQTGDCGITFATADITDAGSWICHMGATNQLGVEHTERVNVRVTGPLAANRKELDVTIGQNATLHCHTANGNRPLDYCRFLSPDYVGISIDSSITRDNAILGRYYFPAGRSLDYGDCSIVISSVTPEDLGTWVCAALINNEPTESSDSIELSIDLNASRAALSQAGAAGLAVGIIALISLLAGVVWYKIGKPIPWRRRIREPSGVSRRPFDVMSTNTTMGVGGNRSSAGSSNSEESVWNSGRLETSLGNLQSFQQLQQDVAQRDTLEGPGIQLSQRATQGSTVGAPR